MGQSSRAHGTGPGQGEFPWSWKGSMTSRPVAAAEPCKLRSKHRPTDSQGLGSSLRGGHEKFSGPESLQKLMDTEKTEQWS